MSGAAVFPDPTIVWRPYPSIIDPIERPPFVFVHGLRRGVLRLVVAAPKPHRRAYGIEIACQIYAGYEEMIYSVAHHGGRAGMYGGGVYIKEAARSALLRAYAAIDPVGREARHFSFVGGDYCYEVLSLSEPVVHALNGDDDAFAWGRAEEG